MNPPCPEAGARIPPAKASVVDIGDENFRLKKGFEPAEKLGASSMSSSAKTKSLPINSR